MFRGYYNFNLRDIRHEVECIFIPFGLTSTYPFLLVFKKNVAGQFALVQFKSFHFGGQNNATVPKMAV